MDKSILQDIINENIEYFWDNDPIVDIETNSIKLWDAFKAWCVQNCMEVTGFSKHTVEKSVNENYNTWLSFKK